MNLKPIIDDIQQIIDSPEQYVTSVMDVEAGLFYVMETYVVVRSLGYIDIAYRILEQAKALRPAEPWTEHETFLRQTVIAHVGGQIEAVLTALQEMFLPSSVKLPTDYRSWFVSRLNYQYLYLD